MGRDVRMEPLCALGFRGRKVSCREPNMQVFWLLEETSVKS